MFLTSDFAKIKNPFMEKNEYGWAYVELLMNAPWYFCRITDRKRPEDLDKKLLIYNIDNLVELAGEKNIKLEEIYVVTPGYLDKTKSWKMDKVNALLKSTNHDLKKTNQLYKIIKDDESELIINQMIVVEDNDYNFESLIKFDSDKA